MLLVTRGLGRPGGLLVAMGLGRGASLTQKTGGRATSGKQAGLAIHTDDEDVMEIEMMIIAYLDTERLT